MTPPPLPTPIGFRIFYGRSKRGIHLASPKNLIERIEDAHSLAGAWLVENPNLEIVSISNGSHTDSASNAVFVTVWFRAPKS